MRWNNQTELRFKDHPNPLNFSCQREPAYICFYCDQPFHPEEMVVSLTYTSSDRPVEMGPVLGHSRCLHLELKKE